MEPRTHWKTKRAPKLFAGLLGAGLALSCRSGAHHAAPAEHAAAPPTEAAPLNPVQHEMLLLTAALQNALAGVGRGDVSGIRHELHRVHGAKDATSAAIASGAYRPPRGADRIERFVELDEAFHQHLARMVGASKRNDVAAAAAALAAAVEGCQGCHAEFRDEPVTADTN